MRIFSGLETIVKQDCPLSDYTWYGLGGKAEYFITPTTTQQLRNVVTRCNENDLPMRVLGLGSNLLVSDKGVRGAVIKLAGEQFSKRILVKRRWLPVPGPTLASWCSTVFARV